MGISIWQLLIILAIVLVLFGAKKIRSLGSDLGASIKNFRAAVKEGGEDSEDDEQGNEPQRLEGHESGRVIDGEAATEQSTPEGGGASGREKA